MVSSLATKIHKTLHSIDTDETMVRFSLPLLSLSKIQIICLCCCSIQVPLFSTETNGQPRKQKFIMGKRNWCSVVWDEQTRELIFDIRVEKEKGCGKTVGYGFSPLVYFSSINFCF